VPKTSYTGSLGGREVMKSDVYISFIRHKCGISAINYDAKHLSLFRWRKLHVLVVGFLASTNFDMVCNNHMNIFLASRINKGTKWTDTFSAVSPRNGNQKQKPDITNSSRIILANSKTIEDHKALWGKNNITGIGCTIHML
jgi:hypothetical protein